MEIEPWNIIERAKVLCKLVRGRHMQVTAIRLEDMVLLVEAMINVLERHEERLNKEFSK